MSKKTLLPLLITIMVIGGFIIWRVQNSNANAAKVESEQKAASRESEILRSLTEEDIAAVMKNQSLLDREKIEKIVTDDDQRKAFLRGLKEHLALAARARRDGLAEDPNFKLNLENKEKGLLADLYLVNANAEGKVIEKITPERIEAVLADPANDKRFKEEFDAIAAVQKTAVENMGNPNGVVPPMSGETLEKTRKGWARTKILSDLAKADTNFMQKREIQLRLKILEAGVLSTACLAKYWLQNIKPTGDDIAAYLAAHPEYDVNKKRATAEMVLQRAKAGEDFGKLAKEFSEDRTTKNSGGLYKDWEKGGGFWTEAENVALNLQKGQVADKLVETKDGFHIIQLVDKKVVKNQDGTEKTIFSVRNILIQRRFEDPSDTRVITFAPPPFKTPEEIAKNETEKVKRQKFIDEIIKSENISMPDDIKFELPERQKVTN